MKTNPCWFHPCKVSVKLGPQGSGWFWYLCKVIHSIYDKFCWELLQSCIVDRLVTQIHTSCRSLVKYVTQSVTLRYKNYLDRSCAQAKVCLRISLQANFWLDCYVLYKVFQHVENVFIQGFLFFHPIFVFIVQPISEPVQ